MAEAAKGSLKPFYVILAIIVVIGGALIARQVVGHGPSKPLVLSTAPGGPPLAAGPRGVVMGSDSAKVEITEFADFECPWCARFAVLTLPDVRTQLVATGKVRWRFVNFPLDIHRDSPHAHLAAACANLQGRFWDMSDAIYSNQSDWVGAGDVDGKLRDIAKTVGLDMKSYDDCVRNQTAWPQVLADRAFGDSVGLSGTPTFMINGHVIQSNELPNVDQFNRLADSIIAASSAPAPAARGARPPAARAQRHS